jgi:hypothetical protein
MRTLLLWLAVFASAFPARAAAAGMELSFERVAVKAGETAALPIYLVSETNYAEPFRITLEFPAAELTFETLEIAYLAEKAGWKVTGSAIDHPDKKDVRIVRMDVQPGEPKFFPSGLVAHARFAVAKDHPDGDILLPAQLIAPVSGPPVASKEPGKITVITNAAFGCFFYMH